MDNYMEKLKTSSMLVLCDTPDEVQFVVQWFVAQGVIYGGWSFYGSKFPMKVGINPISKRVDGWSRDASVEVYFRNEHLPTPEIIPFAFWAFWVMEEDEAAATHMTGDIPDDLI